MASEPKTSLSEEVVRIDEARSALASGHAAGAVRALDAYEERFPKGRLKPEATAVRVEALVQLNRENEARELARPFIAAHPTDGLSVRMRKALGE